MCRSAPANAGDATDLQFRCEPFVHDPGRMADDPLAVRLMGTAMRALDRDGQLPEQQRQHLFATRRIGPALPYDRSKDPAHFPVHVVNGANWPGMVGGRIHRHIVVAVGSAGDLAVSYERLKTILAVMRALCKSAFGGTELMGKPKIGFVGVGGMGQCAHLRNYATLDTCDIVAISELRPELGKRVAAKYGIPNVYPDAKTMLENERLDGIVASQPFDRHGQIIAHIYRYGVPVFTEKPLAGSIPAGEILLQALAAGGSWHMVGYHKRSDPATIAAKAEIDRLKQTGELGALKYVPCAPICRSSPVGRSEACLRSAFRPARSPSTCRSTRLWRSGSAS